MTTPDRIAQLTKRLEDGWQRMNEAEQRGGMVPPNWFAVWERILHEYEALVDEVETQAEAAEQAALL